MATMIQRAAYWIEDNARRAWLIVRHRPLLTCPHCKGTGGAVSGYYEPEWCECETCWDHWQKLDAYGMKWFEGRLPLCPWIRAKVATLCRVDPRASIRDSVGCRLGFHKWHHDEWDEPGHEICDVCYAARDTAAPGGVSHQ